MNCSVCGAANAAGQKFCGQCGATLAGTVPGAAASGEAPLRPAAQMVSAAPGAATVTGVPDPSLVAAVVYAGFWQRAAALLVDGVIVFALYALIFGVGAIRLRGPPQALLTGPLLELVGVWLYWALFESSRLQATPGKLLLRIHVTDLAGRRIGFGRATGRHFARILSSLIFYVGYLMAAFTWRRQALHDMLAGTLVVQGNVTAPRAAHDAASTAPGNATAVGPAPPRHAARNAGTTPAIVVATCVAALFLTGILAAIAIPAYQTYAIRAQVAEGLQLAEAPEQAIRAALIAGENPLQIDQDSLRLGELAASRYVEFVRVTAGSVVIRYGSRSNRAIAGEFLVIAPARNDVNEFSWLCGRRLAPEGWEPLVPAAARYTTIADKYLPARCRR